MNLTKFLRPQPSLVLNRERLLQKLTGWSDKKVVLIHAQAGQGKSTLAAEYCRTLRTPSVWYNMDRDDGNSSLFLTSLAHAVTRVFPPSASGQTGVVVNRFGFGGLQHEIMRWAQEVFGKVTAPLLVVLDDCHEPLQSPELRMVLKILVESTMPNIRLMLISRTQPETDLARLRARQAVGEITGADLRFSDEETFELFNSVYGLPIAEKESAAINRMTEGWPAGLVLTHEYLSNATAEKKSEALFDNRSDDFRAHIFDYLAQEVFSVLPRDLQRFLLRTSIVDFLPVELIARVMDEGGAKRERAQTVQGFIQDLRRRNLFVTIIDEAGSVIRYHALFREFLQRKLITQTDPSEVRNLYTTAAQYFRSSGDTVSMVDLLISSGQFGQAVRTVEAHGLELISRGQVQTLLRWTQAMPLEYGGRPWFLFYRAVAFRFAEPRTALHFLELALAGFRDARGVYNGILGRMLSLCGIIEASFYAGGDFKRMEQAAATASALLQRQKRASPAVKARLSLAIGTAFFFIGRLRQGAEHLQRALELFRKTGDHFYQIQSAIYLAPCSIYHADFARARMAVKLGFDALRSIPNEAGGEAALHMAQAMTALFEGRLKDAETSLDRCLGLAQKHALEAFSFLSLDIGGWIKTATGDFEAAERLLRQCRRKGEERQNAFFTASSAHLLAVNYLHQNKIESAESEADFALSVRARSGSRLFYAVSLAVSGVIDVKRSRIERGERRLLTARRLAKQCEAAQVEANILLALADFALRNGQEKRVRSFLAAGLQTGAEKGFTHFFLFSPAALATLLREAAARGICREYCAKLLEESGAPAAPARVTIACLGGFTVRRRGERLKDSAWKGKQARTLLTLLVSDRMKKQPRDVVIEALWGSSGPEAQRANLASLIYRIRKLLDGPGCEGEGSCLLCDGEHLSLHPTLVETDVERFLAHLEKANRLRTRNEAAASLDEYERAFRLYQGDFLPDDLYEEWIARTRDQLRLRYLKGLLEMAKTAEEARDAGKAFWAYGRLFDADECHEEACRWLMTHHFTAGRRGDAIRTYERCALALKRTVEAEPEDATNRLYRNMIG